MFTHLLYEPFEKCLSREFLLPGRRDSFTEFPVNLYENEENYVVTARIPGVDKSDIEIQLEDCVLDIKVTQHKTDNGNKAALSMKRRLRLPRAVNPDAVDAGYENGELIIGLPKTENASIKTISVN